MGQAAPCNRCSDVNPSKSTTNVRALDDVSSEEEDEDLGGNSEEEDEEHNEEEEQEEAKRGAELAMQDNLKRGKTSTFQEVIEHAAALGIEQDKIQTAEKKLEEHKALRRREAFEAELHDFLRSEEANDITSLEDKLAQGREYCIDEKTLTPVQEKIALLESMKELTAEEVAQVKLFLELNTRRFVSSCMSKGRSLEWIDLENGSKSKVVVKMDLLLKTFSVTGPPNGDMTCKVDDVTARAATDAKEVNSRDGFGKLSEKDRGNAIAVLLPTGMGPWCFLEGSKAKQDEFIVAFQVFNGLSPPAEPDALKTGSGKVSPRGRVSPRKEESKTSKLRAAAESEKEKPPLPPPAREEEEEQEEKEADAEAE